MDPMIYGNYIERELKSLEDLETHLNAELDRMQYFETVSAAAVHSSVMGYAQKRLAKERKRLEKIQEMIGNTQQRN